MNMILLIIVILICLSIAIYATDQLQMIKPNIKPLIILLECVIAIIAILHVAGIGGV